MDTFDGTDPALPFVRSVKRSDDERGSHRKFFMNGDEAFSNEHFDVKEVFLTSNSRNVVRGMHYQGGEKPQRKLVTCLQGSALVKVVNMQTGSVYTYFLKSEKDAANQVYVPVDHALGYRILQDDTIMAYVADEDFSPEHDAGFSPLFTNWGMIYFDAQVDGERLILSPKDRDAEHYTKYIPELVNVTDCGSIGDVVDD